MTTGFGAIFGLFSFGASATRLQALLVWLVNFVLLVAWLLISAEAPLYLHYLVPLMQFVSCAMLATMARRLHHAGHAGRWSALTLIPYAGLVAGLVIAAMPQRKLHLRPNAAARVAGYSFMLGSMVWALSRLWWTPYWVPLESMKPNLLEGDYAIAWHSAAVQRGDVVAFLHPVTRVPTLSRIIALGGDRVAVQQGQVLLNGIVLPQLPQGEFAEVMGAKGPDQTRPRCREGAVGDGAICRKTIANEMHSDGRVYAIADIALAAPSDTFAEVVVPAGHVFLLGDNRDNARDSRFAQAVGGLGFVPLDQIVGPVRRVIFSVEGPTWLAVWTWRSARWLKEVR